MSSGTKLAAFAMTVFLLFASLTGAMTVAVLSDGSTVTTTLSVSGVGNTGMGAGNMGMGAGNMGTGAGNTQSTSGSVPLNDRVSISANATEPNIYRPPST
jgi:hypothetical protein